MSDFQLPNPTGIGVIPNCEEICNQAVSSLFRAQMIWSIVLVICVGVLAYSTIDHTRFGELKGQAFIKRHQKDIIGIMIVASLGMLEGVIRYGFL